MLDHFRTDGPKDAVVFLGGLYLAARGTVRWQIPAFFLLGVALAGAVFFQFGEAMGVNPANTPPVYLYFVTGSTIFAAFFLATDNASSPVAMGGMILYGLLAGALVVLIRVFGIYPDSAPFAVLLASLFTPLLDLIRVKPFGKKRR